MTPLEKLMARESEQLAGLTDAVERLVVVERDSHTALMATLDKIIQSFQALEDRISPKEGGK